MAQTMACTESWLMAGAHRFRLGMWRQPLHADARRQHQRSRPNCMRQRSRKGGRMAVPLVAACVPVMSARVLVLVVARVVVLVAAPRLVAMQALRAAIVAAPSAPPPARQVLRVHSAPQTLLVLLAVHGARGKGECPTTASATAASIIRACMRGWCVGGDCYDDYDCGRDDDHCDHGRYQ